MHIRPHELLSRCSALAIVISAAVALTACTGAPSLKTAVKSGGTKEYFAESEYGVKASPRVSNMRSRLPRGGGRAMVGKPYKVKGKWYKPKEEPNYAKVGGASWYGDAFHGRLTANGEVYDMTHLTAAHPTMPLPSYARVTNQKNGASVVVRVNDRGPFAHGRIVDLSKRAAEMLDYKHAGVAKVRVEYLGRAPLHGKDDQYLLASYRPGSGGPAQLPGIDDGQPSGVMIAMNGRTPASGGNLRRRSLFDALPGGSRNNPPTAVAPSPQPVMMASATPARSSRLSDIIAPGDPILPDSGPYVPERPIGGLASDAERLALPLMSYADRRIAAAASPFDALGSLDMNADDIVASWKRVNGEPPVEQQYGAPPQSSYLAAGSFTNAEDARIRANLLSSLGAVRIVRDTDAYSVVMHAEGPALDALARAAWQAGATDAFVVRSE
ncbi:MAG: septal ring lytic transglycosylase RlpA family protein [Rhizobiaceae bacterium]